jgi:hypothetical protein
MPYTITVEPYYEFAQRHGNRPLRCGVVILFADGASVHPDNDAIREEPPTDRVALLQRRLSYWKQAVRASSGDFDAHKSMVAQAAALASRYVGSVPGPTHDDLTHLNKLAEAGRFCRDEVAKLERELKSLVAESPEYQHQQFQEKQLEDDRLHALELLTQIESVSI